MGHTEATTVLESAVVVGSWASREIFAGVEVPEWPAGAATLLGWRGEEGWSYWESEASRARHDLMRRVRLQWRGDGDVCRQWMQIDHHV